MVFFSCINANPNILNGKPCIKGTRISVQLILEWLADGASIQDIASRHPLISEESVRQAILYTAHFERNEILIEIESGSS